MKPSMLLTIASTLIATSPAICAAVVVGDMNWADEVVEWEGNLMNFGVNGPAELMSEETTCWLTGPPDADGNANEYAFDGGIDGDTVAGWRNCGSNPAIIENFTLRFEEPIEDGEDEDLTIVTYGGADARSAVFASTDGEDFVHIADLGGGIPGNLTELRLDFDGEIDDVYYIKVLRMTTGASTGRFFDAVGGLVRKTPLLGDLNGDGFVGSADLDIVRSAWGQSVEPGCLPCGDPSGDGVVGSADLDIVRGNWGEGTPSAVPEPSVAFLAIGGTLGLLVKRRR